MYVIDAVFIVDVFINFFSAYEDQNKNVRADLKEIEKTTIEHGYLLIFFQFYPLILYLFMESHF